MGLALTCLLALPSCKVNHGGQWSFAVSRTVYGGSGSGIHFGSRGCGGSGEAEAVLLLAIILLPVAIDLVFLPVALTHDLCD